MTTDTNKIAKLNDLCRTAVGIAGRLVQTSGIAASEDRKPVAISSAVFVTLTPPPMNDFVVPLA